MFYYLKVKWGKWPHRISGTGFWGVESQGRPRRQTKRGYTKRTSRHYSECNGNGKWKMGNGKSRSYQQAYARPIAGGFQVSG